MKNSNLILFFQYKELTVDNTLRQALRKTRELRHHVENLLLGEDGDIYEAELKKFVAKRPCWQKKQNEKPVSEVSEFELHLHDRQKNGGRMGGFDLEKYLEESGLITRALSLESVAVKGWIARPETYPEEYKGEAIFLWTSRQDVRGRRFVAYLYWDGDRLIVGWDWLEDDWRSGSPALLASS